MADAPAMAEAAEVAGVVAEMAETAQMGGIVGTAEGCCDMRWIEGG